ncbi:MAG: organoarsenical effux MFS transporter ArsJ [Gammaproteobacteria bacterium]
MNPALRHYLVVTAAYWAFTLTDGALRMLVVLHFHDLGYTPLEVATLFLLYEFFGIVTNLVGGWLGARWGLTRTMHLGMALQIVALAALTLPTPWLSVPWVMAAQALSGIAKDLNKMSAKASVKTLVSETGGSRLFTWVSVLTGSKNALKGAGFFLGAVLLAGFGFRGAMVVMAAALGMVLLATALALPGDLGRLRVKPKFGDLLSRIPAINRLAAARFALFGARDAWFVVGLPVFLAAELGWPVLVVGGFIAAWVIGYGVVQAATPRFLACLGPGQAGGGTARRAVAVLAPLPGVMALALGAGLAPGPVVVVGLAVFGVVFALNSAVHSYLVLAYADGDRVALDVGFYYMANAAGRLAGTLISGYAYGAHGLAGCLWWSSALLLAAFLFSLGLPEVESGATNSTARSAA